MCFVIGNPAMVKNNWLIHHPGQMSLKFLYSDMGYDAAHLILLERE